MKVTQFVILWIVVGLLRGLLVHVPTQKIEPSMAPDFTEPSYSEPDLTEILPETQNEPAETLPTEPTEPTDASETAPQTEPPPLTAPPIEEEPDEERRQLQAQVDELIASVYALRESYCAQLAAIEQNSIALYGALPASEKTEEKKKELAMKCVDEAYALEKQCDIEIDRICAELGYLLSRLGSPQRLVSEVRYAYAYEKNMAKNQLSERYGDLLS